MPADDGIEKSAILLIALGEDYASEVLKHMGPKEVQKLGHAMASLKTVPRARVEEVLADRAFVTERQTSAAELGTLADLYPEMDATGLQERLARMIFVANLWGRLHA